MLRDISRFSVVAENFDEFYNYYEKMLKYCENNSEIKIVEVKNSFFN